MAHDATATAGPARSAGPVTIVLCAAEVAFAVLLIGHAWLSHQSWARGLPIWQLDPFLAPAGEDLSVPGLISWLCLAAAVPVVLVRVGWTGWRCALLLAVLIGELIAAPFLMARQAPPELWFNQQRLAYQSAAESLSSARGNHPELPDGQRHLAACPSCVRVTDDSVVFITHRGILGHWSGYLWIKTAGLSPAELTDVDCGPGPIDLGQGWVFCRNQ